jgi:uncharacterized membrane protein YphA (DoxX/SURF4 family)
MVKGKAHHLGVQLRGIRASLIAGTFAVPEEDRLQKLFSTFPDGLPGIGLILLRLTVALSAILQGLSTLNGSVSLAPFPWEIGLFELLVGAVLLIGFLTPIAGSLAALMNVAIAIHLLLALGTITDAGTLDAIYLIAMSLALVLLGPGAFSLDARLFGRREIIIPESRRSPRP